MTSSSSSERSSNNHNNNNALLEYEILNSLKGFIGGDPFGQYLTEYLKNTQNNIDRLGHAIAAEDFERIRQMAHKLKGSSGNIGALKLSSVCGKLQTLAEEEFDESMCEDFLKLQDIYQETKEALVSYIEELEVSRVNVG